MSQKPSDDRITLRLAEPADREGVARLRYQVYALELGQYAANDTGALHDPDDVATQYLVASAGGELVGCVGVTPPDSPRFGLDRYWDRAALPIALTPATHEIRVLTVLPAQRGSIVAAALMYAAFRWIEDRGGDQIVAMGRQEWLDMYQALGLRPCGATVTSGAVGYDLLAAPVVALRSERDGRRELIRRIGRACNWRLPIPFAAAPACFHGGAFFEAIGMTFDRLERRAEVINADVLDAWFPPAPGVLAALHEHLDWLARTSPPTNADGLRQTIAAARSLPAACVLPGGGSSDLIFLALRHWLDRRSRALLLDPCYGEYAHVLEQVIGCQVDRLRLRRAAGYALDLDELAERAGAGYDLIALVNPNNPTGRHIPPAELLPVLEQIPATTRVWIDEAYLEYAGASQSLEAYAATSPNVAVCKSMSKVYALSGLRAAYLCAAPAVIAELAALTPPWAVSLPAQVAGVLALQDTAYYAGRYAETHHLRERLTAGLRGLGLTEIVPGCANFAMLHLPDAAPPAADVLRACRERGLFLRDVSTMGRHLGDRAIRIAVKDEPTIGAMLDILRAALSAVSV